MSGLGVGGIGRATLRLAFIVTAINTGRFLLRRATFPCQRHGSAVHPLEHVLEISTLEDKGVAFNTHHCGAMPIWIENSPGRHSVHHRIGPAAQQKVRLASLDLSSQIVWISKQDLEPGTHLLENGGHDLAITSWIVGDEHTQLIGPCRTRADSREGCTRSLRVYPSVGKHRLPQMSQFYLPQTD